MLLFIIFQEAMVIDHLLNPRQESAGWQQDHEPCGQRVPVSVCLNPFSQNQAHPQTWQTWGKPWPLPEISRLMLGSSAGQELLTVMVDVATP